MGDDQTQQLVHVVDPNGTFGTIDKNEAPAALGQSGYRLATPQEIEEEQKKEEYGTGALSAVKAAALGAARSSTFGLSDEFLTSTGAMKSEDIENYKKYRPGYTAAGEIGGVVAALAFGPESAAAKAAGEAIEAAGGGAAEITAAKAAANKSLSGFKASDLLNPVRSVSRLGETISGAVAPELSPYVGRVLSQAAAGAVGSSIEGAAYGLGQTVSEQSLGDPGSLGEKLFSNVGNGMLTGGVLGGAIHGGFSLFGGAEKEVAQKSSQLMDGADKEAIEDSAGNAPENPGVSDAPKTGVQPTSIDELEERVAAAKQKGMNIEMPQKGALEKAASNVSMDNPIHPIQLESLESQAKRDIYNTTKEDPSSEVGKLFRENEAVQKQELNNKTDETIKDIAPNAETTDDVTEAGNNVSKAFTDQYQAEQKELKPIFESLKGIKKTGDLSIANGVVNAMTDAVPGVSKMFSNEGAEMSVLPYKTAWGIDRATYNAVKEAFESLKEEPSDFQTLKNIRKGLDQHVDVTAQGQAASEIRSLKKGMMEYMQDMAQKSSPDLNVRDGFKRYAINEQHREIIENIFGSTVGSKDFSSMSKVSPELVLKRIFSNSANINAAKSILGEEKFNEVVANYLSIARKNATKDGVFSSNKFGTLLTKEMPRLKVAMSGSPEKLQRLVDLNTISRIIPDAASVNPSGTAKTLSEMIKKTKFSEMTWEGMLAYLPEKAVEKISEGIERGKINSALAGKKASVDALSAIERIKNKIDSSISSGVNSIFSKDNAKNAMRSYMSLSPDEKRNKHDEIAPKVSEMNANPEGLIDHLNNNTKQLSVYAPQTASGVQRTAAQAVGFLKSKLPGNGIQTQPLSKPYKPSDAELSKFNKYHSAIENPTGILNEVAAGSIGVEHMEALQAVYPKMLQEMQTSVTDKLTDHMAKDKQIPYRTKMALSLFLGHDMVNSLNPTSMLANQNTLATATQAKEMQEQGAQNRSVNQKNIGKIGKGNRLLTDAQASAQRDGRA